MTHYKEFFSRLDSAIEQYGCDRNLFYSVFIERQLNQAQLQFFADQYFYYIRTFPQILAGLAHRVDSEETRFHLARTIVSELGEGRSGKMHFQLFEKAIGPLGVRLSDWHGTQHVPEAEALVGGIRALFIDGPVIGALGGHYTIEKTGLPMIFALYEGIRKYPGVSVESLEYFYLHLVLEADHVTWIERALEPYLADADNRAVIESGAVRISQLLAGFWDGLHSRLNFD